MNIEAIKHEAKVAQDRMRDYSHMASELCESVDNVSLQSKLMSLLHAMDLQAQEIGRLFESLEVAA